MAKQDADHTRPLSIVWFRQDLRIEDHPALLEASSKGRVLPLYIWDPEGEGNWAAGEASKWWLHYSLMNLSKELQTVGMRLVLRQGNTLDILKELIAATGATSVFWNRRYEPASIERDAHLKRELHAKGIHAHSFNASLLFEPWTIANQQGKPFQVFTPFWKACLKLLQSQPISVMPSPQSNSNMADKIPSLPLADLHLLPAIPWDQGIKSTWTPGAAQAKALFSKFLEKPILHYEEMRNFPAEEGISRMSPYLHFGEISPRMIWHQVVNKYGQDHEPTLSYLRQLGWREFAYHLLYHFPQTPEIPLKRTFLDFPWKDNKSQLQAWQKGETGYPIVDAGMRQLWKTGWMHNRVRMIVGSFLVKDLLISWNEGARWFWDTLVDADLANNTLGWQWIGGCGADAAPYFRIFNPVTQGETFDPDGIYVRRWVPELAALPNKYIHKPWQTPESILREAGILLGHTYPFPIVDHAQARKEALAAFSSSRRE